MSESIFIPLPINRKLIFVSWRIDPSEWKQLSRGAEEGGEEFLHLELFSTGNGVRERLEDIPVFGRENSWHLFLKEEHMGKRVVLELTRETKGKKKKTILASGEISLPVSDGEIASRFEAVKTGNLYRASGIDLTDHPTSGRSSS